MESLRTIALAQEGDDLPEMPVLYTGTFEHSGRKFDVTEADLDQAIANFNAQVAQGTEIPVDYEHGKAEGGVASGWYKGLRRAGNRLLAKIAWTDKAREQIRNGERRYFSPEFALNSKNENGDPIGFRLLAGALVTRPHLKGLGAVSLSEEAAQSLAAEALAGDEEPRVIALPKDARDMAETVSLKDHEELTAKLSEATEKITALAERVEAAEQRADTAEANHETVAKALFAEQLKATLDRAQRQGRIDAKDSTITKWSERAEKHGIEFVAELLNDIPAETIPVTERGHAHDRPEHFSDAPEGVDADRYVIDERAQVLLKEGKTDDYATAARMAADELGVTL